MNLLPPVTKNLLIINVLCYLAMVVGRQYYLDLNDHIFFNMFALWMFGRVLEQILGPKQFLIFYMVCGLGAGLTQELAQTGQMLLAGRPFDVSVVGASGAVYGILLGFGYLLPEERIFIFPLPVPIKAKYFVIGYAVIELTSALAQRGDGVAHCAHLGGMLFGFLLLRHWRRMRIR